MIYIGLFMMCYVVFFIVLVYMLIKGVIIGFNCSFVCDFGFKGIMVNIVYLGLIDIDMNLVDGLVVVIVGFGMVIGCYG